MSYSPNINVHVYQPISYSPFSSFNGQSQPSQFMTNTQGSIQVDMYGNAIRYSANPVNYVNPTYSTSTPKIIIPTRFMPPSFTITHINMNMNNPGIYYSPYNL